MMQRTLVPTLMTLAASNNCPSSPFEIHAQTYIEFSAATTCANVADEIQARAEANQEGTWVDPHNGGKYFFQTSYFHICGEYPDTYACTDLDLYRQTGTASIPQGGPFTDRIAFHLEQIGGCNSDVIDCQSVAVCKVSACSASQVESVTDFSGGYCNIRNLICGSDVGCATEKYDFGFVEGPSELSPGRGQYPGASADASMCIVPTSTKVEADVSSTCQERGTEVSCSGDAELKACQEESSSKCCSGRSELWTKDHQYHRSCCYYCPGDAEMNSTMV